MVIEGGYDFLGTLRILRNANDVRKSSDAGCIICKYLQAMDVQRHSGRYLGKESNKRGYRFTISSPPTESHTSIYANGCHPVNYWGETEESEDVSIRFHVTTARGKHILMMLAYWPAY